MKISEFALGSKIEIELYENEKLDNEKAEIKKHTYISQLENINSDTDIVVAAPIYQGMVVPIRKGAVVHIYIIYKDGLYKFKARVKGRFQQDDISMLNVEVCSNIIRIQRRQFFRINAFLDFKYRIVDTKNEELKIYMDNKEMLNAVTLDIGGGGIRFLLNIELFGEDLIECTLDLGNSEIILVKAKIIRVENYKENANFKYIAASQFIDIDNNVRDAIISYTFVQQIKLRNKGML